jgi:hypothetical protein
LGHHAFVRSTRKDPHFTWCKRWCYIFDDMALKKAKAWCSIFHCCILVEGPWNPKMVFVFML